MTAVIFFIYKFTAGTDAASQLIVKVDNEITKSIDIKADGEYRIDSEYGYNLIEVKEGNVSVISSDCSNKICVKTGKISKTGETIVCLPHRLIVYLE